MKNKYSTSTTPIDFQNKKRKKISPPFGYFGSKNKIAMDLINNLPPHNCWVEAFCGSAALTLAKNPAPIEVINDIDDNIINVFKQLRDNHTKLIRLIKYTPYARKELSMAREENSPKNDLEKARIFLVQAMFAINGVFGKERGGFSYSQSYSRENKDARVNRWYNLSKRLEKVVERLRYVRIENRNAIKLLKMFVNRPATLVYLDPPYLGNRTNGYDIDENSEKYHSDLLSIANSAKCMIFISSYENDLYSSILGKNSAWSKTNIISSTKGSNGKSFERNEVVWMNRVYIDAFKTGKVPIKLTKDEFKNKKLNPER